MKKQKQVWPNINCFLPMVIDNDKLDSIELLKIIDSLREVCYFSYHSFCHHEIKLENEFFDRIKKVFLWKNKKIDREKISEILLEYIKIDMKLCLKNIKKLTKINKKIYNKYLYTTKDFYDNQKDIILYQKKYVEDLEEINKITNIIRKNIEWDYFQEGKFINWLINSKKIDKLECSCFNSMLPFRLKELLEFKIEKINKEYNMKGKYEKENRLNN